MTWDLVVALGLTVIGFGAAVYVIWTIPRDAQKVDLAAWWQARARERARAKQIRERLR